MTEQLAYESNDFPSLIIIKQAVIVAPDLIIC